MKDCALIVLHTVSLRVSDLGQWLNCEWLWALGGRIEYWCDEHGSWNK